MSEKNQYVGLEALIRIIAHIKAGFATLGHKHLLEDIEDYVVDEALSSTSTNPVQNKVITAKVTEMGNTLNSHTNLIANKADSSALNTALTEAKAYTDESIVTYTLSKEDTTILLNGSDNSVTYVEESVTTAIDDSAGNVVLESMTGLSHLDDSVKQELINATIASLNTETLTFTLDDGTKVTKEVVVK